MSSVYNSVLVPFMNYLFLAFLASVVFLGLLALVYCLCEYVIDEHANWWSRQLRRLWVAIAGLHSVFILYSLLSGLSAWTSSKSQFDNHSSDPDYWDYHYADSYNEEQVPSFWLLGLSLFTHILYRPLINHLPNPIKFNLFSKNPESKPISKYSDSSLSVLIFLSLVFTAINQVCWVYYDTSAHSYIYSRHNSDTMLQNSYFTFFIWLMPLLYVISALTYNEAVGLPVSSNDSKKFPQNYQSEIHQKSSDNEILGGIKKVNFTGMLQTMADKVNLTDDRLTRRESWHSPVNTPYGYHQ